jgi:nitrogenase molybdenum-iron protein alpha/beta subunit
MNATSSPENFASTFNLPYQLGIYLAANAVSDSCVVLDGANCVMPKIDFLAGNHDLYSTLLSAEGAHRIICTMSCPLPQKDNPERPLLSLLSSVTGSGRFAVVLVTGLPFLKLAGMDYAGLAAAVGGKTPVADIPPASLEADWLEGYAQALDALARALPERTAKKRKRTVALAGYLPDRHEGDHAANIQELRTLLKLCGLELTCVFPSGGSFRDLSRALDAELIVSLPYGRKAAQRLAKKSGARLVETGLPMDLKGTADWLRTVQLAAGIKGGLPQAVRKLEQSAAAAVSPLLDILAHKNLVYAGDPCLFAAFYSFARELRMNVPLAIIDSFTRPLGISPLPAGLLFAPDARGALAAIRALGGYRKPDLVVGNSFARTEGFSCGLPLTELGFPSYGHHCLGSEPFLGFTGAKILACRLFNSLQAGTP